MSLNVIYYFDDFEKTFTLLKVYGRKILKRSHAKAMVALARFMHSSWLEFIQIPKDRFFEILFARRVNKKLRPAIKR